jgi:3',5'-cyclic AMP phosphodiesterase CpdA
MKIIHFSDIHAGGPAEDWMAYIDKRWVGVFNYRWRRRFQHNLDNVTKAVNYIFKARPDVVVYTGDLTSAGQPGEFAKTKTVLDPLLKSDIPVIFVPGNHDCYVYRPKCVEAVRDAVEWMTSRSYTFDDFPFRKDFGELEFIVINNSRPSNLLCSWGFMDKASNDFIVKCCSEEKTKPRVLIGHYPIIEDHPIIRVRHRLFKQKEIVKLLKSKKIDLSLCGHIHRPYAKIDASGRGEMCAGSVTRNGSLAEIIYSPADDTFSRDIITL